MDLKERRAVDGPAVNRHPWELARLDVIKKLIRPFCAKACPDGNIILDIGCGDGFVTRAIAEMLPDFRVIGVDHLMDSDDGLCGGATGPEFYRSIDRIDFRGGAVCLVLLLDVLEHVSADGLFLHRIMSGNAIADNAVFFITVPAIPWLYSRHDRQLSHFRRYSGRGLIETAERAGILSVRHGSFFFLPIWLRIFDMALSYILDFPETNSIGVSAWRGKAIVTRFLKFLLICDFTLSHLLTHINISLPGLSWYLIGRKRGS